MANNGRIVFTASGTHDPDTTDGKMVGIVAEPDATALATNGRDGKKPLSGGKRYSTSKLCMILYAYELDRRLRRSGSSIASIAFDPGSVPETGLLRTMPKPVQWLAPIPFMKAPMHRCAIIARKAGVGLGTLYRHFPAREALLEVLLRASFDELTAEASELEVSKTP